jgi:hypothetical protein
VKTIFGGLAALMSLFIAAGLILPALAQVRDFGSMPEHVVPLYTMGVGLGLFGIGAGIWIVFQRCRGTKKAAR